VSEWGIYLSFDHQNIQLRTILASVCEAMTIGVSLETALATFIYNKNHQRTIELTCITHPLTHSLSHSSSSLPLGTKLPSLRNCVALKPEKVAVSASGTMKMGVPALAAAEGAVSAVPRLFLLLALTLALTLALELRRLPGGALDVASVHITLHHTASYHIISYHVRT
jgi:hypothetical protein